ncbi:MAG: adenosine deaminase [Psychromonas sp.]
MSQISFHHFLSQFPKADLHYHLLGGVRLETMLALAKKYNYPLSLLEAKSYYRAYQAETGSIKGGIEALTFLYELLQEAEDYEQVLFEVAEDAHACGVRYIETFWNPSDTHLSYQDVNQALVRSIKKVQQQFNITIRLIPSINREKSPELAVEMVEMMLQHPHPYVLGIGIDYIENNASVEKFWQAYRLAKDNGYKLAAHCGEFGLHWRNVVAGIELIQVDRMDHGYSIIENAELTAQYAAQGIPFTVVPSNTYFLNKWPEHNEWRVKNPIRAMGKAGLNIIPCTDDWHMHATDSTNCYRVMVEDFGFDIESLKHFMLNSISASWLPEQIKKQWISQWSEEFDLLRSTIDQEPLISADMLIEYRRHPVSD